MYNLDYFVKKLSATTAGGADEEKIKAYQDKLGFVFPSAYLDFVKKFGNLTYNGRIVLGVSDSEEEDTYKTTMSLLRDIPAFPEGMIVIENVGVDNNFLLLDSDGSVYRYAPGSLKRLYNNFDSYIVCDVLQADAIEIAERFTVISELLVEKYGYHKDWANWEYRRLSKIYGAVMLGCARFDRREMNFLTDEIYRVEYALFNNTLKTVQEIDSFTKKDYLCCFLDVARGLMSFDYSFTSKYLLEVVSGFTASNEEEEEILNAVLITLTNKENTEEKENKKMEENTNLEIETKGGTGMEEVIVPEVTEEQTVEQTAEQPVDEKTECGANAEKVESAMAEILERLDRLQEAFDDKIAEDEHKNKLFDNMHKELTKYQNGLLDKLVDSIAMDIIQLLDATGRNRDIYSEKEPSEENYAKLLRCVKGVAEDLEDILYRQDIEPYSVPGDEVDVRRQKIIQIINTDDEALDNKVAERTAVGYTKGDKIMRPERIKIYKYVKKDAE